MMPLNGAVFALDGILIGAGDTRFLMWGMLAAAAVYVPIALLALAQGWGIVGVWCGLAALIVVRLATCGARFAGERWALTGAPRVRATLSAAMRRLALDRLVVLGLALAAPVAVCADAARRAGRERRVRPAARSRRRRRPPTPTPPPSVEAQEADRPHAALR